MRHGPGGLLRRQWCPVPLNHPGAQFQRTERAAATGGAVQAACNPHRAGGTGVGRRTSQDPVVPLALDLDPGHIQIETGQLVAQRFTLGRHEEAVQVLLERREVLNGLTRLSTPTQKVMELIHRLAITGQQGMTLQCLHGGTSLEKVVLVKNTFIPEGRYPVKTF
jgi:hypothetical protein